MKPFAHLVLDEFGHIKGARRTLAEAQRYIDSRVLIGVAGSSRWWIKPVAEFG